MFNFNFEDFVNSPEFVIDCCTFEANSSIAENSVEVLDFYVDLLQSI